MDTLLALGLVLLAAAYLLRRSLRTFRDPEAGACGGSDGCSSGCSTGPATEQVVVQLQLPRQS